MFGLGISNTIFVYMAINFLISGIIVVTHPFIRKYKTKSFFRKKELKKFSFLGELKLYLFVMGLVFFGFVPFLIFFFLKQKMKEELEDA